jgi:hypothetical protein
LRLFFRKGLFVAGFQFLFLSSLKAVSTENAWELRNFARTGRRSPQQRWPACCFDNTKEMAAAQENACFSV